MHTDILLVVEEEADHLMVLLVDMVVEVMEVMDLVMLVIMLMLLLVVVAAELVMVQDLPQLEVLVDQELYSLEHPVQ